MVPMASVRRIRQLPERVLHRILSFCWRRLDELVLALDLGGLTEAPFRLPEWLRIEPTRPGHEPDLQRAFPENPRLVAYMRTGHSGFIAYRGEAPVGYIWYAHTGIPQKHRHPAVARHGLELDGTDVYLFDFYLLPECRGGGVATGFLHEVCAALRKKGYRRAYGFVEADFTAARWLYTSTGWRTLDRRIGHLVLQRLLYYNHPRQLFLHRGVLTWWTGEPYSCFDYKEIFPRGSSGRSPGRIDKAV